MKASRRKMNFVMTREGGRLDYTSGVIYDNRDDYEDEFRARKPSVDLKYYYEIPHVNAVGFILDYLKNHDIPEDELVQYSLDLLEYGPTSLWHYTRNGIPNYTEEEHMLMHNFFALIHDTDRGAEMDTYYDDYADQLVIKWAADHGCELFEDDSDENDEEIWRLLNSPGSELSPDEMLAEMIRMSAEPRQYNE